jgi:hypothetical protein
MAKSPYEDGIGGATVARDFGTPKKLYGAPPIERIGINTARAALEAEGASKDANAQQMLASIDKRLAARRSAQNRVRRHQVQAGVVK